MSSAPACTISRRLASGRSVKARRMDVAGISSWIAARRRRPDRLASDGPAKSTVNGPCWCSMSPTAPTRLQATTSTSGSMLAAAAWISAASSSARSRTRILGFTTPL